ncbi:hypothetical protein J6590_004947 [Homalodisca vitripennis]|nr:hypothetical protein J6590_004947 [Homalodisca vitripennis]
MYFPSFFREPRDQLAGTASHCSQRVRAWLALTYKTCSPFRNLLGLFLSCQRPRFPLQHCYYLCYSSIKGTSFNVSFDGQERGHFTDTARHNVLAQLRSVDWFVSSRGRGPEALRTSRQVAPIRADPHDTISDQTCSLTTVSY